MQTRAARRLITYCSLILLITSVLFGATRMAAAQTQAPTIASDLADYNPGGWVTLTGTGWLPNATVHIVVNDDVGQTWSRVVDVPVAADGAIKDGFQLPNWFVATYFVTATGNISGSAVTTFADPNPSANLDQCANDQAPSPSSDGCNSDPAQWVNGNLGASKAVYFEGDSIPYRLTFGDLSLASHTVTFEWDTTKSSAHALDYLTSYNYSVLNADPCLGVSGCGAPHTFPIPADSQITDIGVTPAAGNFTLFGGTINAVSAYSYPKGSGFAGDMSARITITFTASVANPVLAWGGHISTRKDWGMDNSAVAIPGSPYHTRLIDLDGSGGNQDRSLSADAVIFPGSITVVKDATPNGSTSFDFTASPSPLANFSLVDDGTPANTKMFSNITNFTTYTVAESVPTGWDLTGVVCTVTSPNGGSQAVSGATSTINLNEGENVTCTYSDLQQKAHLIVIKHVINDNGGTAAAGDFSMTVTASSPSPASFAGVESPGTTVTLDAGSYSVSETGPAGYTASYSADCTGTLAAGETKTCTVTNDDNQPKLTLVKTVDNKYGGTKQVADFPLFISGASATSGTAYGLNAGSYTASETQQAGYTASAWGGDCAENGSVTLAVGDNKTCTITNSDIQPTLTLVKTVENNYGGTKQVADFPLFISGASATSGVAVGLSAGNYTASETQQTGYTASVWGGDCAENGSVTLAVGDNKTCTITNSDIQPKLTLVKTVENNYGGTKQVADFPLFINATAAISGTAYGLNAGNYTASETQQTGYTASNWGGDCTADGTVTLAVGDNKTCTITNTDVQPKLKLVKTVVNNYGGLATAGSFQASVSGTNVAWDVFVGFNAGSYDANETDLYGYTASAWGTDCAADGAVTLAVGDVKTCTITNSDVQPKLTLVKTVANNYGGTKQVADFPLFISGAPATSGEAYGLNAGSYTASETQQTGYTASVWGGDCAANGSVTLAVGDNKTCTITNSDVQPTLKLVKTVDNQYGGPLAVAGFPLFISGAPATSGTAYPLNAGPYTASETQQPGYTASAWGGDCAADGSVTLAVGDNKTCTITNSDIQPKLTLVKHVVNDDGGTLQVADFPLFINTTEATSGTAYGLNAGNYIASETQQTGYTASAWSGDCAADGSVTLVVGDNKTCYITNDDVAPTLTLVKTVDNKYGGTLTVADFPLFINTTGATSGTAYTLKAGTYTASETQQTGYAASAWGGDCAADGSITLAVGDNKTCTITNSDVQPKLTLVKTVENNYGGTLTVASFPLFIDTTAATSGTAYGLNAGTYTASETQQYGYTASVWGGACAADGSVTLAVGDNKTCTITNSDIQPTLKLVKTVVNDNGGTKVVADFPLFISGTAAISNTAYGLNAGTYTASETQQYGYTASTWGGDCAANGSVTLAVGDEKTCTITNDDKPGTIIVQKLIKPVGALTSFTFNTTGMGYTGFSLSGGQTNSQTLNAGSYTVMELVPLGWVLTGIGGSSDTNAPYNCKVTGSGGSTGVGDLTTQTATIDLKNGDTVTCVFENTGQGVTRTQGFWATHPQLANIAWFGGTAFGHTFPGVTNTAGIGDMLICGRPVDTLEKVMGGFWSDISKTSTGAKRSSLDQAKMQLLQQLLAAELNASAFGSVPSKGSVAAWESALCGSSASAVKTAQQQAASFNTQGDSGTFTPGTSADSKTAREVANKAFWDVFK